MNSQSLKVNHRKRVTSQFIFDLKRNEVFVFGSNLSGMHGAGAAAMAKGKFKAVYGQGTGPQGKTYAIPTKGLYAKHSLPIELIRPFVDSFIEYARFTPKRVFLVTEIGCGLAGFKPADIAPLFAKAKSLKNVCLPQSFWDVLKFP